MGNVSDPAADLNTQVVRLTRQIGALKAQLSARSRHGMEWSSYVLLFHLVEHGPMRASALADRVCSDPSTVSRQVAALVELGMVERQPDAGDRRAVQLAASERGHELLHEMRAERTALVAGVVAHWPPDDVSRLASLMDRFTTDLERHRSTQTFDHEETA